MNPLNHQSIFCLPMLYLRKVDMVMGYVNYVHTYVRRLSGRNIGNVRFLWPRTPAYERQFVHTYLGEHYTYCTGEHCTYILYIYVRNWQEYTVHTGYCTDRFKLYVHAVQIICTYSTHPLMVTDRGIHTLQFTFKWMYAVCSPKLKRRRVPLRTCGTFLREITYNVY